MEMERSVPQHIQQMVMRDFCAKRSMHYLLAAVEYRMPGCTMVLDAVLKDCAQLDGIVMYSIYQMPTSREKRMALYATLFENACTLHAAAENISINNWQDAMKLEDSWLVMDAMRGQTQTEIDYLQKWDAHA
jgi:sporadic carbohydrate cluster protein (TIGR04323 family)